MYSRKLLYFLWAVIAILVIGGGIGGYFLVRHANDLDQANTELMGNNDSLKRQLEEAKATPAPTPTPVATPAPSPTPTPGATISPKATATPKPTATPLH